MKLSRTSVFWLIIAMSILTSAISWARTQTDSALADGKKTTVRFSTSHSFGGFTLKPGDYEFQHRVHSSGDHIVYFTVLKGRKVTLGGVRCQLEPLPAKANETAITTTSEGGVERITRIVIRSENVAHVFLDSVTENTLSAEQRK